MTDVNVPLTIWRPTNGNGEAVTVTQSDIVDTTGAFLVDTTGAFVVDTGVDFNPIPQTVWSQDDSV